MTETEHPLLLASVVLLRLREFTRRPVAEQARLAAQLDAVLAVLLPDFFPPERIVLEGNGSAAVVVLDNPLAALRLAERALAANEAGLELTVGIDHGPIEVVAGESGNALTGDVVATATTIAAFAADYGLLVSQGFRTALAQARPGSEAALVPAGVFSDAALRSYQLFRADRAAVQKRSRRFRLIAAGLTGMLLAAAIAVRMLVPERPRPLAALVENVGVPVLERVQGVFRGRP